MSGGISSKRLGRKDECEKPGLPTHATNDDGGVVIEPRKELLNCIVVFLLFTWACQRPRPRIGRAEVDQSALSSLLHDRKEFLIWRISSQLPRAYE